MYKTLRRFYILRNAIVLVWHLLFFSYFAVALISDNFRFEYFYFIHVTLSEVRPSYYSFLGTGGGDGMKHSSKLLTYITAAKLSKVYIFYNIGTSTYHHFLLCEAVGKL